MNNVLPQKAWTVANLRILQGDSVDSTLEHIKKVNPDINFQIEKMFVEEPSEISKRIIVKLQFVVDYCLERIRV